MDYTNSTKLDSFNNMTAILSLIKLHELDHLGVLPLRSFPLLQLMFSPFHRVRQDQYLKTHALTSLVEMTSLVENRECHKKSKDSNKKIGLN